MKQVAVRELVQMKASSALMGIALVALGGVTLHHWRELETGRQQIEVSASKAQEVHPSTAASPVSTPAQIPAETHDVADQPSQSLASDRMFAALRELEGVRSATLRQLQTPEGQAQLSSFTRLGLESSLPDLDKVLDLTDAEKDRLLDLLTLQRVRGSTTPAPEQESARERDARQQRRQETEASELQALLGNKYLEWKDYHETASVRKQGRELSTVLNAADIPLSQTQEQALLMALVFEQRSINQNAHSDAFRFRGQYTPENRRRLLNAASPYLSQEQLDKYEGILERKATMEQPIIEILDRNR